MQLINEQDDLALGGFDFLQHGFQPLLEFAAEFRARDQRAEVQREDGAILEVVRHIAADDTLGKPLGDGGLADAGLTDQAGIVLGFTGQNTDDMADFLVTSDDGIQLALPRTRHQIGAVFLEDVVGVLRVVARDLLIAADLPQCLQHSGGGDVLRTEQGFYVVGRVLQNAKQDVLDRDVVILHLACLLFGFGQRLVERCGDIDAAGVIATAARLRELRNQAIQLGDHVLGRSAHAAHDFSDQSVRLCQQGIQQMLLLHGGVTVLCRGVLGATQGFYGFLCQFFGIHISRYLLSRGK